MSFFFAPKCDPPDSEKRVVFEAAIFTQQYEIKYNANEILFLKK